MSDSNKNKSLIFIKSTVVSLGIILMVMMISLIMVKYKRSQIKNQIKCDDNLNISVKTEIEKFEVQGSDIVVLTKVNSKSGKQEIIRFDSNCGRIISKTTFAQKPNKEIDED
jgi:hypothetical protein